MEKVTTALAAMEKAAAAGGIMCRANIPEATADLGRGQPAVASITPLRRLTTLWHV